MGFSEENQYFKPVTKNSISPVVVRKNEITLPALLRSKTDVTRANFNADLTLIHVTRDNFKRNFVVATVGNGMF